MTQLTELKTKINQLIDQREIEEMQRRETGNIDDLKIDQINDEISEYLEQIQLLDLVACLAWDNLSKIITSNDQQIDDIIDLIEFSHYAEEFHDEEDITYSDFSTSMLLNSLELSEDGYYHK